MLGVLVALVLTVAAGDASVGQASPLIGTNYTELTGGFGCGRRSILRHGHEPGALRMMRLQLAAMRAAGIESLRFFIWHDHDGAAFETIPSAGGRVVEPYRSTLVTYLEAARDLRYKRVEIVFGPVLANDPMAIYGGVPYDPALFDENWALIRDVRALAKEHGPPSRFDLLNEGAPSDAQALKPQVTDYLARLYRNYVDAFGNQDVTVSTIYQRIDPTRLPNLLAALRASRRPLPGFFEIHPDYAGFQAFEDLRDVDAVLSTEGLHQPLEVGEGPYNDAAFAAAVGRFVSESTREVSDVLEWPLQYLSGCRDFSVGPPYRATALIRALKGDPALAATRLLQASLPAAGNPTLTDSAGLPVTALEDGVYSIRIEDRSSRAGFWLAGPHLRRATGGRFRGSSVWRVKLRAGT